MQQNLNEEEVRNEPREEYCFDCKKNKADPTILGYYEVCRPCYDDYIKLLREFKTQRPHTCPQIDEIIESTLYLGNEDAANDKNILEKRQITAILVCGSHLQTSFINDSNFKYKVYQIHDDPRQSVLEYFDQAFEWLEERMKENRKILIHCAAGISRSASFTIAYLMKKRGIKMTEAKEYVKQRRQWIHPNSGFIAQLLQYQEKLGLGKHEVSEEPSS